MSPAPPGPPHLACHAHTLSASLRALFYAPSLFGGRHTILKDSQDQIQQSLPQRSRINKNTGPPGHRGSPVCQATLRSRSRSEGSISRSEERWLGQHLPRFLPGTGPAPGECVANRMGRGRWASGQAGVRSEGNRAFSDCKHSNRHSCL